MIPMPLPGTTGDSLLLSNGGRAGTDCSLSMYEDVNYIAILIIGTPKIMDLPANGNGNFAHMPTAAELAFTTLESSADTATELQTPAVNRLVRYLYTPFGEEIFNISEAQVESMIEPDRVTDALGQEPVAVMSGFLRVHPDNVPELALL